jgi:predicted lysophospholipase L1 biosynthesis ABC-type transport system permease subunit
LSAIGPGTAEPIQFAVTSGRSPRDDGEVAIGQKTARDLDVGVGGTLRLAGLDGSYRVVGLALFPPDVHAEFDEGIWLARRPFERLVPDVSAEELFTGADRAVLVRFPRGTDSNRAIATMQGRLGDGAAGVFAADLPTELVNLRNVRRLPLLLALFLGLLAVGAVSHVLATCARRRRHDFAVLRALGLSRRGSRMILFAQGTAIGIVGVLFGVPLGVAAGRTVWRWVASLVPLQDVAPLAVLAIALIVPATLLIVNALAVWPGRHVSRVQPAEVLRAE